MVARLDIAAVSSSRRRVADSVWTWWRDPAGVRARRFDMQILVCKCEWRVEDCVAKVESSVVELIWGQSYLCLDQGFTWQDSCIHFSP
jgi:hypothetical protein